MMLGSLLAVTLLAAWPAWAKCWRAGRPVKLDVAALAKKSPWAGLSKAEQEKLQNMGARFGVMQPLGPSVAVAWTPCKSGGCFIKVGLARKRKGRLKVYSSVSLPHRGWAVSGAELHESAVTDLDGDGKRELLVSYTITSAPERAVGSTHRRYLAVLSLPTLSTVT
ncbi:hypothetical protein H8E07_04450 [bacterium]|nr:hypothetical protein [bacterium]